MSTVDRSTTTSYNSTLVLEIVEYTKVLLIRNSYYNNNSTFSNTRVAINNTILFVLVPRYYYSTIIAINSTA